MSSHKQTWIKHLLSEKQMSEAFVNSVFLALSGGFQDAYTYNTRDEVFSNAQTGNVVLMSQHFMNREWQIGLRYLFPLLAFMLGVFVAENVQNRFKYAKKMHWRQAILLAEIGILAIVGFIPNAYNMIATVMVSFACAMQVQLGVFVDEAISYIDKHGIPFDAVAVSQGLIAVCGSCVWPMHRAERQRTKVRKRILH